MTSAPLAPDLAILLADAQREIARLDGPENPIARRLREAQGRLVPLSATIGELARRIDVSPREVLDAAIAAGVRVFWHEGKQFRTPAYLESYLALPRYNDPLPELELDIAAEQCQRLAEELGVEVERLTEEEQPASGAKPARRFAASQTTLDEAARERKVGG